MRSTSRSLCDAAGKTALRSNVSRRDPSGPAWQQVIDGSQRQFAYQGIVGLAIPFPAVPGLAITADYRYFATHRARIPGELRQATGLGTATYSVLATNENRSVLVGLRYAFGK